MVKHKTGKLSKRDPNDQITNIPELQFHLWFSGLMQLFLMFVIVLSVLAQDCYPDNQLLPIISKYSFYILILPLTIAIIGFLFLHIDLLINDNFWDVIAFPFRIILIALITLIKKPSVFTPKNLAKRLFKTRDIPPFIRIVGWATIIIIILFSASGIATLNQPHPLISRIFFGTKIILLVWTGLWTFTGSIFFAFSSSALLIINWLTPIFGFAPEETEAEKIQDEFTTFGSEQEK